MRGAQSSEAAARADLADDPAARAEIERQRIREAAAQTAKEIASKGPKKKVGGGTGEYSDLEVAQLTTLNSRSADFHIGAIDLAERRRSADELRSLERADIDNQRQALQAKLALADTTAQRRDIAKQLLDLDYKQREADLHAVLAPESRASDAEKVIAGNRLKLLPTQKAADQKVIDKQNEGRGAADLSGLSPDRKEFIQDTEVKALDAFNRGLDDSVAKALHLHGVFGNILADLIDMAIKQALIKPIAGALFGGGGESGSGGGGFFGSLFGAVAGAFGGGKGAALGKALNAGRTASPVVSLPGFASGGSATIGGNPGVDQNVLSINGIPSLRVGRGEQLTVTPQNRVIAPNNTAIAAPGNGGQITVHVQANDYFDARVAHVSGPIAHQTSVRVVQAAAPTIVGQAVNAAPARVSQVQTLGS